MDEKTQNEEGLGESYMQRFKKNQNAEGDQESKDGCMNG